MILSICSRCLYVSYMKRGDLRLVRIGTQTVVSVVLCDFTQCLFIVLSTCEKVWNWAVVHMSSA